MFSVYNRFKKGRVSVNLLIAILWLSAASCKVSNVFLRDNQVTNQTKNDGIVRLYMDKFGAFYPSTTVPVLKKDFEDARFLKRELKNPDSFNLEYYFTSDAARLNTLRQAYQVTAGPAVVQDFNAIEERIITGYVTDIKQQAAQQGAGIIVFLIHGFNEPNPELPDKYPCIRESISKDPHATFMKPLYVEVYWDGLTAFGYKVLPVAKIWTPSQYNSRWVGLSLRNFIHQMEGQVKLPIAIVTHSLGAGVATCALFNNTSKWNASKIDSAAQHKLNLLMRTPTPTGEVRLGLLAPAIPGASTFIDFNKRSPGDIQPAENKINKVVIAYEPFDYATSKDLFKIVSLAPLDGSTTLGCNYYSPATRYTEIESVFNVMHTLGYDETALQQMIRPIRFRTPERQGSGGNHEHFIEYYIGDTEHSTLFFSELFK